MGTGGEEGSGEMEGARGEILRKDNASLERIIAMCG